MREVYMGNKTSVKKVLMSEFLHPSIMVHDSRIAGVVFQNDRRYSFPENN